MQLEQQKLRTRREAERKIPSGAPDTEQQLHRTEARVRFDAEARAHRLPSRDSRHEMQSWISSVDRLEQRVQIHLEHAAPPDPGPFGVDGAVVHVSESSGRDHELAFLVRSMEDLDESESPTEESTPELPAPPPAAEAIAS